MPKPVLIVEDDPDIAEGLRYNLEREGLPVVVAESGERGLAAALDRDLGSLARWRSEFTAMGKALAGGSGWVVLAWSPRLRRLVNHWAADHAHGLAGGVPVLALDMYEHSYHLGRQGRRLRRHFHAGGALGERRPPLHARPRRGLRPPCPAFMAAVSPDHDHDANETGGGGRGLG